MRQSLLVAAAAGIAVTGFGARALLRQRAPRSQPPKEDVARPGDIPESDVWRSIADDVEPTLMQDPMAVQRSRQTPRSRADID